MGALINDVPAEQTAARLREVNLIGERAACNADFVLPFAIDDIALVAVRHRKEGESAPQLLEFDCTFERVSTGIPVTRLELENLALCSVPGWGLSGRCGLRG